MNKLKIVYDSIIASKLRSSILIGIVCIATFGNTLLNDYNLDDNLVTQNHRLTSKGIKAIPEIYRSPYYQDDMGYSYGYRPTTLATFAIEHELFGESPLVSHSVNLLLYLITCILVFLLIRSIFPDQIGVALGTALLFTVHPIHTEVVASIKNRDEILALLFMLGAMKLFAMTRDKDKWIHGIWLAFLGICFVGLSLSSKLSAAVLILLIPFVISESLKPIIRIGVYSLINLILVKIFHARSGFYPWYFFTPFLTMAIIDVWKSVSWRKRGLKANVFFTTCLQLVRKLRERFSNWALSSLRQLKQEISVTIRNSVSFFKTSFRYLVEIENLRKALSIVYNWADAATDSVKTPLALSFVFLLGEEQFISMTLLVLFLLVANRIPTRYRTLLTHFVILTTMATSGIDVIAPIIFPFLFFRKYFSKDKPQSTIVIDIIYLITGLALIFTDLFIINPASDPLYITTIMFSCYSLSVVTSWFFVRLANLSGIRFLVAQAIVVVISSAAILTMFNIISDDVLVSHSFSFLILIQIFIKFVIRKYVYKSIRVGNYVFSSVSFFVALFLLAALLFNSMSYTIRNQNVFVRVVKEKSNLLENEKLKLIDWFEIKSQDYSSVYESERVILSKSAQAFKTNTLIPLSNSSIPFKFDSAYVFQAIQLISEQQQKSDYGRPLDFIENPIPVSSNQFLRYGFYLSTVSRYLVNFCIPIDLAYYYGFNEVWVSNFLEPTSIFVMLALILLGISAIVLVNFGEFLIGFSLIITVLCILPFSGALEPLPGTYSPRFAFVSSLFYCSFVVGIAFKLFFELKQKPRVITGLLLSAVILVLCSAHSIRRNTQWKDKLTLMRHDIKNIPNSAQAHNLLAHAIMEDVFKDGEASENELKGRVVEASKHFHNATEIYPRFFNAWVDLGKVNRLLNNNLGSVEAWQMALTIDSTYSPVILQLAQAFESLGDYEKTVNYYRNYLRTEPNALEAYDNLARILYQLGRYEESIEICQAYLKINPNQPEFLKNIERMQTELEAQKDSKAKPS